MPVLLPRGWWAGLGPEANKLDVGFQNGACQHQTLYGRTSSPKWLPPVSLSLRLSTNCLLPLCETVQDQQVGLIQTPFKLLLLIWVPEHVRFCVHPLRVECLFPTALCV